MEYPYKCYLLDILPLNLIQRIVELTCTDGGLTGNVLSLTCKRLRAAVRPSRFRSVHLRGDKAHLDSFLALYERERSLAESEGSQTPPHVRHLLLTLPCTDLKTALILRGVIRPPASSSQAPPNAAARAAAGTAARGSGAVSGTSSMQPAALESSAAVDEARRLIHMVAPNLQTLGINWLAAAGGSLCSNVAFLDSPFPLLSELTVHGRCDPKQLFTEDVLAAQSVCLPALTHLHLMPAFSAYSLDLPLWFTIAPRISHIRVSGVPHVRNIHELAVLAGVPMEPIEPEAVVTEAAAPTELSTAPSPSGSSPHPDLRCIVVQAGARPKRGGCGNMVRARAALKRGMAQLEALCRETDIKCVVLDELQDLPSLQHAKEVRLDWMERIRGEAGCWPED
ncbi:hypothetical protein OH77DRAFT_1418947 [Trametes cingulata]|nr:hypothetical protein OH77DRAFT_1418947 [Trametes cingulata]